MSSFESKFGQNFLNSVPTSPGVYRVYGSDSTLIYIGKAKNLRRRLGQYKNAKRRRKHRKMRKIVEGATSIQFEVCATEQEAELLETKLIQDHRPRWNIVGAFYFMYPMIGMNMNRDVVTFCYTTQPELCAGFSFHGAFRSREITGEAFFSLMKLLRYVGHPSPRRRQETDIPKYSYIYRFRQLPSDWEGDWSDFWQGKSRSLLENLILQLVENAKARQQKEEVQSHLNKLARFWTHEALALFKARTRTGFAAYPVSQKERDVVFLRYRHI